MREYLLLLPLIFIFHDMEEMVGFGWFFRNNPELYKRFPRTMKNYIGFTEMGMTIGVYEEFFVFGGAAILAYYFPSKILYAIWFGFFMALAGHFVIHIWHTLFIRKYIPSFMTSVISFPVSVIILIKSAKYMKFDWITIAGITISLLIMIGNFLMIHSLMRRVNKKINSPDKNYNIVPIPGKY